LFDFFLACRVGQNEPVLGKTKVGSPYYMAPELFGSTPIRSRASDIWAFGCLLYEMVSGNSPFSSHTNLTKLVLAIQNDSYSPIAMSSELSHLINACLIKLPQNRITWNGLLGHPFWVSCKPIAPSRMPVEPLFSERYTPTLPQVSEALESPSSSSPVTSYHTSLHSLPTLSFSVSAGSLRSSKSSQDRA